MRETGGAPGLSNTSAYVIVANGRQSYFTAENVGVNMWKALQLRQWVTAGGTLILLDGATGYDMQDNSYLDVLDAVLDDGSPEFERARCSGFALRRETWMQRRSGEGLTAYMKPSVEVRPNRGAVGLVCSANGGQPLYSHVFSSGGHPSAHPTEVAIARFWRVGRGGVYWLGSSFAMPSMKPFQELLTIAISQSRLPKLDVPSSPPHAPAAASPSPGPAGPADVHPEPPTPQATASPPPPPQPQAAASSPSPPPASPRPSQPGRPPRRPKRPLPPPPRPRPPPVQRPPSPRSVASPPTPDASSPSSPSVLSPSQGTLEPPPSPAVPEEPVDAPPPWFYLPPPGEEEDHRPPPAWADLPPPMEDESR
ncbi:hypothetical protein HYH03_008010 [Edaphochlamys debaryana]|uniref:Uncharacterized protein n=1 Tax=Edaphochlamys debaryana TaxID=47281 RepID=A0A835Y7E3_9CHLO|nr:hypothetical protein HYH03_008010 [Edaphochlamys debaryana]|eukprot:KAG2493790.1 hypothetical protein HYH03_008010 [Edaphochlamys debaryana]